ncbi:MAG TPA: hypothetical protein VHF27_10205 [Acidimicrobiales bacterium]|nr:hypothetical protein [Acidimicrobiales bacterium]
MDEDVREPVRRTRWLGWTVAALLTVGVVSAGTVSGGAGARDQRIVTAAGEDVSGVEVPTTTVTAVQAPTTEAPSTTTTEAPRPTTTQPPRTTTTKAPAPSTATTPTTRVSAPAGTTLTVVNEHPLAVAVTVNGKTFQVAPGQQSAPTAITRSASGNDVVEVTLVQQPSCGTGDADRYFPAVGSYRMTISAGPGLCQPGMPGPAVKVTPA